MSGKIFLIPYLMFPKASLPYRAFSVPLPLFCRASCANRILYLLAKFFFYQSPPHGVMDIPFRQFPYTVKMIRQQNPCFNFKRMRYSDLFNYFSESLSAYIQAKNRLSLICYYGEKVCVAVSCSSVIRHYWPLLFWWAQPTLLELRAYWGQ